MAKRKKRRYEDNEESRFYLNPEAKRGVIIIIFFALAAIMILSFFQMAGSLGSGVDALLNETFGWDRFLIPLLLIITGVALLFPERNWCSTWTFLGFFFFLISFNGLLNFLLLDPTNPNDLPGGWLGQFLAILLPRAVGYWGALVIIGAILLVSLILIFNASLRSILGVHHNIWHWFKEKILRQTPGSGYEEGSEDETETEEEEAEETDDDEETDKEFTKIPLEQNQPEQTLLIRHQRKITIPLELLNNATGQARSGDVERSKEIITKTFEQFGINVEMGETATGP